MSAARRDGVNSRRQLTAGQLTYLRGRPLYPWAVWMRCAQVIFVLLMIGASIVDAHAFALSLFCLTVTLVPIMVATEYLVMRQLERVVLSQGESRFRSRVAFSNAIWTDALAIRRW